MQYIKRENGYGIRFYYEEFGLRKRKYLYKRGWTKTDAELAMLEFLQDIGHIINRKITLTEYLSQFFTDYVLNNVAASTQKRYAEFIDIQIVPNIGHLKLIEIKPAHIQSFYSKLRHSKRSIYKKIDGTVKKTYSSKNLSSTTILHVHRFLNLALKYAVQWEYLRSNPAMFVKAPTADKKEIEIFTEDEIKVILQYLKGKELFLPVYIAYTTGMRLGEVCGLQYNDVDLIKKQFTIRYTYKRIGGNLILKEPKTKTSARNIPFLSGTFWAQKNYALNQKENKLKHGYKYNKNNFYLRWKDGRPITPDYVSKTFKTVLKRLDMGDNRSFHTLRHTHASWLLMHNVHPKIVSERLGHSNVNITLNTYSHLIPNLQKEVIENLPEPNVGTF